MATECTQVQMGFKGLGRRKVQAAFDGGHVSSDGGALLLRETDERFGLCERFAGCFTDYRDQRFVEHRLPALIRQRVLGLCLGYEDLNDHDTLSLDPLLAAACGNPDPEGASRSNGPAREAGRALAAHSTLDRLELTPQAVDWSDPKRRYYKLVHHPDRIEDFFVDVFLDRFETAPEELVLDFDPTDILLHGELELFDYLVGRIRAVFPQTRIIIRGDSAFAREPLMRYCETGKELYYLFGLARNARLVEAIRLQLHKARQRHTRTARAARLYTEFRYRTLLLKIGARVIISVRRVVAHLSSAAPYQDVFIQAWKNIQRYPLRC